jgi:CDGSH-type Zn-finger protein/uncharacterized Fe-S cluster protein YjdI
MSEVEAYEGKHLTLMFDGARCIHARQCVLSLPEVFKANVEGPWIDPDAAEADEIRALARRCPSGAITYTPKDGTPPERAPKKNFVTVWENGPYAVRANLHVHGQDPAVRAVLCRCGASKNKPYCDGSHVAAGFASTGELPTAEEVNTLEVTEAELVVTPLKNGPLKVEGPVELVKNGGKTIQRETKAFLCRCGASKNKPYCDGTHSKIGFEAG